MTQQHFQTLICGAGVSGLYSAWRLLEAGHDPARLLILEATDRIGGRLWSRHLHEESRLAAELGGMFFNDGQPLVYGLCRRAFDLEMESIRPEPDFAWLRAQRFPVSQFADPAVLPYHLEPEEQGLNYYQLLDLATRRIAPELDKLWPNNPKGSRQATIAYLRKHRVDDRPLHDWGFWNLLARVISNEAWQALRDIVSSHTMFANWNGYDAMVSLVVEQAGNWYRLSRGYQQLPERLAAMIDKAGTDIRRQHIVERVHKSNDRIALEVGTPDDRLELTADRLVLACPRYAIARLIDASPQLHDSPLAHRLESVRSVPACKVFLTFDDPWWRRVPEGPGKIAESTYAVSHTDLPLRQCYYLGYDEAAGQGLMLASYADGDAVGYWRALMADDGRHAGLQTPLSRLAAEDVRRQLSAMHDFDVPTPSDGVFVDWTQPPYGGAWHNWQPGWKSWETTTAMLQPISDWPLHVCGESWSTAQGWVEGALETAEAMLTNHFDLERPDWAGPDR